jgi:hypothetical protein
MPTVAAHLILGSREEPFLPAMLDSLDGVASTLIVNDNSSGASPHDAILVASRFGREGRLIVDRTPFTGFAAARNICLQLHAERSDARWVAFIDADEVHGARAKEIAARLDRLPADYDFVDGYTWHFFGSFEYYTSIERRMMFFRFRPDLRWEGAVHERLHGLTGKRLALPYVYGHYGHTLQPRRHAEKGRQYSSLGAPGNVLRENELHDFDVERYFAPVYPRLMRFAGRHPEAARTTVERLALELRSDHATTHRVVAGQGVSPRVRNVVRQLNYELRWRSRALSPWARRLSR